jgi:hypothetical protein
MSDENKDNNDGKVKIVFMEGCFDEFDGTQEELNELITQLTDMANNGNLLENSIAVDIEDMDEEVLELLPMLNSNNTRH